MKDWFFLGGLELVAFYGVIIKDLPSPLPKLEVLSSKVIFFSMHQFFANLHDDRYCAQPSPSFVSPLQNLTLCTKLWGLLENIMRLHVKMKVFGHWWGVHVLV